MDYEIIATLGPASNTPEIWTAMLQAGVTAFRLNTAHLSPVQIDDWLVRLSSLQASRPRPVPIVLDMQGSKWRLGEFDAFELREGETVELVLGETTQKAGAIPVPHRDFFSAANGSSTEIAMNDARSLLRKESSGPDWTKARVVTGGQISPHKGITYLDSEARTETMGGKDETIISHTRSTPGIRYAISYLKDAGEMRRYRELLGDTAYLIAKLERQPAISEARQVAEYCNEVWLCRGDMGAELGIRAMAEAVYSFGLDLNDISAPCIIAGQVLDHMTGSATPTRSEVCFLYEALQKGYRGCVLSDETAVGQYPLQACQAAALFRG